MIARSLASLLLVQATALPSGVDTLDGLGRALTACWSAPAGSAGSDITVLLSFTRTGAVLGKPRVTHSHLLGSDGEKQAFVAAAFDALARCTPVSVTPGLGGAIAGRPFTIRFVGGRPALRA